jgi:hypothetical protein
MQRWCLPAIVESEAVAASLVLDSGTDGRVVGVESLEASKRAGDQTL